MTEVEVLERKLLSKGQAVTLLEKERNQLRQRLFLLQMRDFLLDEMEETFDPALSQRLDCIDFLLRAV